jgi:pimeloyl-ACP methyl ester carboxylesterase
MTMEKKTSVQEILIDAGGCRLHFSVLKRSGGATIVLEVGGGADSTGWGDFPSLLAQETGGTVLIYDRAGFGRSDLPETPCNMMEEAGWLMEGLRQLGLDRDIILVGHSYGGWQIRMTASQYPESVSGIVFVDPFTTEFVDRLGVDYLDEHPFAAKDPPFDTSNPAALTKNQRGLIRMVKGGLGPKVDEMRGTIIPADIPVRIITAGEPWWKTPEEDQAWREAHEQMAASIPGAVLLVAEGCDHYIPEKKPEIIIKAVKEVIQLANRTS